jgi:hypothetical protein
MIQTFRIKKWYNYCDATILYKNQITHKTEDTTGFVVAISIFTERIFMRRAIKVKAFVLFMAWLTIFAHAIIPHNHIEDNPGCHNLIHNSHEASSDNDNSIKYSSQPDDIKVCHLSGFLFQNFTIDNLLLHKADNVSIIPVCREVKILFDPDPNIVIEISPSFVSFRAPPSV